MILVTDFMSFGELRSDTESSHNIAGKWTITPIVSMQTRKRYFPEFVLTMNGF